MSSLNRNTIALFPNNPHTFIRASLLLIAVAGVMVSWASTTRADDLRDTQKTDSDAIKIVTSALGLEAWTKYSANPRAVGYGWASALGFEASYYDLGDSKFAKNRVLENNASEDVGRRVDVKLAVDLSTPITPGARVYSRVGVYLWDVDVNYNRSTREFNSSREGNSGLMGVGAALKVQDARLSFEYERLALGATADNRDPQRILMHVSSQF